MLKMIVSIGLGSALVFTALPAFAQTGQSTVPAVSAPAATTPTGSHKSPMQHRASMSRKIAKASAHHKIAKVSAHHKIAKASAHHKIAKVSVHHKVAKASAHHNIAKASADHIRHLQSKTVNS